MNVRGALVAVAVAVLLPCGPALASATHETAAATVGMPAVPRPAKPVHCPTCWHPALRTTWNWVLSRVPKAPYRSVQMYDVDGFETSKAAVASLHAADIKVVCYLSAGTYENFRPDADQFPARLLGRKNGWPGERWLDIRELQDRHSVLRSIMDKRLDMCQTKGFDMVELDNVDGWLNHTGFPLTGADQLYYNATLANAARSRGMSVLQKNDNEQIPKLLRYFDGALNEQCNQYKECTTKQNGKFGLDQYVAAGKPVFQAEYRLTRAEFCQADNTNNFNGVRFDLELNDRVFQPCRT
ncbi:MAG: hypothetical protein QOI06_1648 [Nocardioidaceae bacterium]|jgi:hypothetical protein|nr:hypothetical protein [Nocardioidaceae bacterium]